MFINTLYTLCTIQYTLYITICIHYSFICRVLYNVLYVHITCHTLYYTTNYTLYIYVYRYGMQSTTTARPGRPASYTASGNTRKRSLLLPFAMIILLLRYEWYLVYTVCWCNICVIEYIVLYIGHKECNLKSSQSTLLCIPLTPTIIVCLSFPRPNSNLNRYTGHGGGWDGGGVYTQGRRQGMYSVLECIVGLGDGCDVWGALCVLCIIFSML